MSRPPCFGVLSKRINEYLCGEDGALTTSFVVMSSAAVTVTTATVLTVSTGADIKSAEVSESLVQIEPGEVLNLDEPPYNFPVDDGDDEEVAEGGTPSIIETEPFRPGGSDGVVDAPSLLPQTGPGGGGGGTTASSGGSGGGFSGGILLGGGGTTANDEEEDENTVGSRS